MTHIRATILGGSATDQQFVGTAFREAVRWIEPLLVGSGVLDYEVRLGPIRGPAVAETYGMEGVETAGGLYEPGTVTEMKTGVDPNGAVPDADMDVDVAKLATQPNAIITMMHEIVHGLAFNGGGKGSDTETLFDAQTDGFQFVGAFSEQVNGGPVLLSADLHHYLQPGLMNPYAGGDAYPIGALDVAMMADSGVPVLHIWAA